MDNRKFEQLIELIINENEEQARALFHDIVVEKSREIYESIMDEEAMAEDMSGGLLDEIESDVMSDEEGMSEEEDEFADIEIDDEEGFGDEDESEDLEDRVVDLEDKLDQLMAEFEEIMGHDDDMGDDMGDMGDDMGDMDDEDMMEARHSDDDEEDVTESEEDDEESVEESLEESVQLTKVPGLYDSKIGGDNGAQSKSPTLTKPKVTQTGAKPVNFSGESSTGGTKGGLASPDTKDVEHASQWKNRPSQKGMNLEKAPSPKHGDNGSNTKSPLGESKKSVKKIIKK
jgi:hypothetical protein